MPAISIRNVSKIFLAKPTAMDMVKALLGIGLRTGIRPQRIYSALSDITLDIPTGQCVGIIGRNGSGKSTLLRTIAGIVKPSSGRAKVKGKLSTVLDVHSGLNPRMTGRQNIYLKGAIFGLDERQMKERIDAIIDFSGLAEFIDQPIHTYSTGMVIRLGFSIAMNMEFDILLMDEVLSVGDIPFQRQCLARVRSFIRAGKTIVLASHSLADVSAVCSRVIYLDKGSVRHDGRTEQVIQDYWDACEREKNLIPRHLHPFNPENIYGRDTGDIAIKAVHFFGADSMTQTTFWTGDAMSVAIQFKCCAPVENPLFRIQFFRNDGLWVHGVNTARTEFDTGLLSGEGEIILDYERLNLLEGDYYVTVGIWPDEYRSMMTNVAYDCHQWAYVIHVKSKRPDGAGIVSNPFSWRFGVCPSASIEPNPTEPGKKVKTDGI
jgi:ABC-type polysaccharide/polyol phosphate transport system ATPase subunit